MGNEKSITLAAGFDVKSFWTGDYMGFRYIEYHLHIEGITLLGKKING